MLSNEMKQTIAVMVSNGLKPEQRMDFLKTLKDDPDTIAHWAYPQFEGWCTFASINLKRVIQSETGDVPVLVEFFKKHFADELSAI